MYWWIYDGKIKDSLRLIAKQNWRKDGCRRINRGLSHLGMDAWGKIGEY